MEFRINKIGDWQNVVNEILPELQQPILLLKGNLGAGKTTFTQFLLKNLAAVVNLQNISSLCLLIG